MAAAAQQSVRVRVLGPFEIEGIERVGSRKARTLLKVLALAKGAPVPVDQLTEYVWPEEPPRAASKELSVLISRLRSVLGPGCLIHTDAGYSFRPDWLDLTAARALAEQAASRLEERAFREARDMSQSALELFRGPLLSDEPYADWAEPHRVAAAELAHQIRETAARSALAVGHMDEAEEMARTALEHDSFDEVMLRILMVALARGGRQASAVAEYGRFRTWLGDELGISPSAETDAVHTAILKGTAIPDFDIGPPGWADQLTIPSQPGTSTVLPGRTAEIATLDSALAVIAAGEQRMLLFEGEMGAGKTTLIDRWTATAQQAGTLVMRARCRTVGRLFPLQGPLDAIAGHLERLGPENAESYLRGERAVLKPLLRNPFSASIARVPTPVPEALFEPLLDLVRELAHEAPTVIALDDLQHAGQATWDWLHFLSEMGPDVPVLVLATRTAGFGPHSPGYFYTIPLVPLDESAAAEIVGSPQRAQALLARSGGNPLLLTELAAWDTGDDEPPPSIVAAVSKVLDGLGPLAMTLRTAAVLGATVDLGTLERVLGLSGRELLEHLKDAARLRLLSDTGRDIRFNHEVVREAVVASTPVAWRDFILGKADRVS